MLKAMGHVGAMAKLEEELEEDTLDLASGVGGKELTAKARALAVSRAAESLEAAIRSSPIATAKLHNTYSFEGQRRLRTSAQVWVQGQDGPTSSTPSGSDCLTLP